MHASIGLRAKLALVLSAFGLLPLAVVGVITLRAARDVRAQAASAFESVAENVADKVDRNLFERYGDVQAFGFNNAVFDRMRWYATDTAEAGIVHRMDQFVDAYDLYYLTLLVDLDGKVAAVNSRDGDGKPIASASLYAKSFRDAPWFKACLAKQFTRRMPFTAPGNDVADGTVIQDLHVDSDVQSAYPGDDGRTIGFSAPVYEKGQMIGCWHNAAKFSLVQAMLATAYSELKAKGYPSARLTLLDSVGGVILDFDPAAKPGTKAQSGNLVAAGLDIARQAVAGRSGFAEVPAENGGEAQAAGYTHLRGAMGYPGMNWSVLLRAPQSELAVVTGIGAATRWIAGVVVTTLVLVVVVGLVLGRRASRPIVALSNAATRIAAGDLDCAIAHQSDDEIGTLAQAFERMRGTTQDLVGETARLTAAARAGDLAVRGDSARFEGAFRAVVEGTNQTLDGLKALTDEARAQRDVAALFITEVGEVLGRTAAGDLTARVHGTYQGDHAEIQRALNSALGTLDDALTQVSSAAGEVSEAAGQITHGAQSLSEGASSQAAQLEEVSASLHELSAVTQRNSEGAARALTLTNGARQSIEEGAAAVERLAGAMSELQRASGATAKIVRTIDEIAFQTNLLALNAAVEAARAGDAGRGFAVVAEEVRALARRSAEAAQQTATLIQESVLQARSGAAINADVLASFNAINERAAQVGVVVAEITSACEEQAQGVAQISTAVERMNDVTQQVASAAEQSASAATEMASQSNGLAEMVGGFHLTGQTPPDDSPSRDDAVAAEPHARHRRRRRRVVATA